MTPSATAIGQADRIRVEYGDRVRVVGAGRMNMNTDEVEILLDAPTPRGVGGLSDWIPREAVLEVVE